MRQATTRAGVNEQIINFKSDHRKSFAILEAIFDHLSNFNASKQDLKVKCSSMRYTQVVSNCVFQNRSNF